MPTSPTSLASAGGRLRPPSRPGSAAATATTVSAPQAAATAAPRSLLYAQPASVHFGGFSLDAAQGYTQRLRVHNNSAKPVRLQYTLPTAGVFRVSFPGGRKPFLSPGLHEELLVAFAPTAYQYYYDCVQVKCEEVAYASNADAALLGRLLVPLHAYPVVNAVRFPTRMDFGAVPLGATARRHVDLTCSVPIAFEFALRVTRPHAAFSVFPLEGTIPANGAARVEFEFKPLLFATARAEVELHVSQLGFAPLTCVLAGSSASDVVAAVEADEAATTNEDGDANAAAASPTRAQPKTTASVSVVSSPAKKSRGSAGASPAKRVPASEMIDGVEIPADLASMASVNFVLTQQPGKLKPKDLKRAIDANRAMREQQKREQAALTGPEADGEETNHDGELEEVVSPAVLSFHVLLREEGAVPERARVARPTREMFFLQELAEIETIEKELEFQSHKVRRGQALLTPAQLDVLRGMRALNERELARRERETLRNAASATAFHLFTPPTPEMPYPPRGALPAHAAPAIRPEFKSYTNDLWDRRRRVVQRLVRAISTVIVRNRAQKRLTQIRAWLGGARTRAHVREKVARDWQQFALQGSGPAPTGAATGKAAASTTAPGAGCASVYLRSFPIVEEKDSRTRAPIALSAGDWDLSRDPFAPFALRERDEALVAGHEPLELPPLATYVPLERERELRRGALDECTRGISDGGDDDSATVTPAHFLPAQDVRMPSALELMPRDVFLRPSAAVRPLVRVNTMRETLTAFPLRPQRVFRSTPRHWGLALDTGVGTRCLRGLRAGLLRIHERYQPRTERVRGTPPLLLLATSVDGAKGASEASPDALYRGVWDASDGFVPPLSTHADDVPCLSDSESDDDDDNHNTEGGKPRGRGRTPVPMWQDALRLFEADADAEDEDDGVAYEPGELLGRAQGITCFERYRHLIQSEREYNAYRDEKLTQLPTLLADVARRIDHPDYELVVEGHGPSRPLHEPFAVVFERTLKARASKHLQQAAP